MHAMKHPPQLCGSSVCTLEWTVNGPVRLRWLTNPTRHQLPTVGICVVRPPDYHASVSLPQHSVRMLIFCRIVPCPAVPYRNPLSRKLQTKDGLQTGVFPRAAVVSETATVTSFAAKLGSCERQREQLKVSCARGVHRLGDEGGCRDLTKLHVQAPGRVSLSFIMAKPENMNPCKRKFCMGLCAPKQAEALRKQSVRGRSTLRYVMPRISCVWP